MFNIFVETFALDREIPNFFCYVPTYLHDTLQMNEPPLSLRCLSNWTSCMAWERSDSGRRLPGGSNMKKT